ncbi:MAG TPA: hypothetical protein DCS93_39475 [Microscillaceae bacterium]|nr:hypothetical protein [Microscillaceae bacterium]
MGLLWLSFATQAQTLNQQLIAAVHAGQYARAKQLILRGANPNSTQKIFIKGHTRESYLKDYMKVKSKGGAGIVEITGKAILLPMVLLAEILTPRKVADRNEYYSVLLWVTEIWG